MAAFGAIDVDLTTSGLVFATQPNLGDRVWLRRRARGWRLTWRAASQDRSSTCVPAQSCHDSESEVEPCCRPTRAPTSTSGIVASW